MAILYEDKPSRVWFWGGLAFLALLVLLVAPGIFASPPSPQGTGDPTGLGQAAQDFSEMGRAMGIMLIVIMIIFGLIAYTLIYGTSFAVTDEGIEWTKFFQKNVYLFSNIALVDSADIQLEVNLVEFGSKKRHPLVKTAGGEVFRPDEYYTDPTKQGIAVFLKNGEKIFVMVKDRESPIKLIKNKMS